LIEQTRQVFAKRLRAEDQVEVAFSAEQQYGRLFYSIGGILKVRNRPGDRTQHCLKDEIFGSSSSFALNGRSTIGLFQLGLKAQAKYEINFNRGLKISNTPSQKPIHK
jgi:hypothetical protein